MKIRAAIPEVSTKTHILFDYRTEIIFTTVNIIRYEIGGKKIIDVVPI